MVQSEPEKGTIPSPTDWTNQYGLVLKTMLTLTQTIFDYLYARFLKLTISIFIMIFM